MARGATLSRNAVMDDELPVRRGSNQTSSKAKVQEVESKPVGKTAYTEAIQRISKLAKKFGFTVAGEQKSRQRFLKDENDGRELKLYENAKGVTVKFHAPTNDGIYRSPKVVMDVEQAVELAQIFFGDGDLKGAVKYVKPFLLRG